MDTVAALLDKCRDIRSLPSDAALAVELHVTRQAVSNWRVGRAHPDELTCARISAITGQPLGRVLGIVGEARAVSAEAKKVWRRLAETAVFALAALGLTGAPGPASAIDAGSYPQRDALYIMRNWWAPFVRSLTTKFSVEISRTIFA